MMNDVMDLKDNTARYVFSRNGTTQKPENDGIKFPCGSRVEPEQGNQIGAAKDCAKGVME